MIPNLFCFQLNLIELDGNLERGVSEFRSLGTTYKGYGHFVTSTRRRNPSKLNAVGDGVDPSR